MASVDARFADDIQQVRSTVEQPVDPVDFSDGERQRQQPQLSIQPFIQFGGATCPFGGEAGQQFKWP